MRPLALREADIAAFFCKENLEGCVFSAPTSPAEQQTLPLYGELRLRARPTMTSLIAVSSYTDTDILAHTPKGAENDQGIT